MNDTELDHLFQTAAYEISMSLSASFGDLLKARTAALESGVPENKVNSFVDKAFLSVICNAINWAVHPLARKAFLDGLPDSCQQLDQMSDALGPGAVRY
jgi:hypothetical protein